MKIEFRDLGTVDAPSAEAAKADAQKGEYRRYGRQWTAERSEIGFIETTYPFGNGNPQQNTMYCRDCSQQAQYRLMIWPHKIDKAGPAVVTYHCEDHEEGWIREQFSE